MEMTATPRTDFVNIAKCENWSELNAYQLPVELLLWLSCYIQGEAFQRLLATTPNYPNIRSCVLESIEWVYDGVEPTTMLNPGVERDDPHRGHKAVITQTHMAMRVLLHEHRNMASRILDSEAHMRAAATKAREGKVVGKDEVFLVAKTIAEALSFSVRAPHLMFKEEWPFEQPESLLRRVALTREWKEKEDARREEEMG